MMVEECGKFVVLAHYCGDECEIVFRVDRGDELEEWAIEKFHTPYPIVTMHEARKHIPEIVLSKATGRKKIEKTENWMSDGITALPPLWPESVASAWNLWPGSVRNELRQAGWSLQACRKAVENPTWAKWKKTRRHSHLWPVFGMTPDAMLSTAPSGGSEEWPGVFLAVDGGECEIVKDESDVVEYQLAKSSGLDGILVFRKDEILKPYPSEHACRLNDPSKFDEFRRGKRMSGDKGYGVIWGKLSGEDKWDEQAYRYPRESWSEGDARAHCHEHGGKVFEPARKSGITMAIKRMVAGK